MSTREEILSRLTRVARALGPVRDDVALVGGCAPALYDLVPSAGDVRPTEDIDLLVDVASRVEYDRFIRRLKESAGIKEHRAEGAPICRYELDGIVLDLMPTRKETLGFGNPWYGAAMAAAELREIGPGVHLRVIPPLHFVATKLEAFSDRGRGDALQSEDLEDIVSVLIGRRFLACDLRLGREPVHDFARGKLRGMLEDDALVDAWMAHAGPSRDQQDVGKAILSEVRMAVRGEPSLTRARVTVQGGGLSYSVPRVALTWEAMKGGGEMRRLPQEAVDREVRTSGPEAVSLSRCWAPSPFDSSQDTPVIVEECECPQCSADPETGLPCLTCRACLAESLGHCPRCERPARRGVVGRGSARSRGRTGFVLTESAACLLHDHDRCPLTWSFNAFVEHRVACACSCHGPSWAAS